MTDEEFCRLYTSFFGEEIDNIKQLKVHSFNGEELLEFTEHVVRFITSNTMLVCDVCNFVELQGDIYQCTKCLKVEDRLAN